MRQSREDRRRDEFEGLLVPHLDALYGTALRLTRKPEEAEDLLQEASLKAFRFLDRYQRGTNFKAWMFKILTNVFHSRYRKAQREREVRQKVEADGHQTHVLAQGPAREAQAPEETILDHLLSEDIQEALYRLPPDFRMVVLLSDVEEFTYREIADIMDCPVGTVMSRLFRARRQLQHILVDHAADRGYGDTHREADSQGLPAKVADLAKYRSQRRR